MIDDSSPLLNRDLCPHCRRETLRYRFLCAGHWLETHHCREHGDVVPMRRTMAIHHG